VKLLSIVIPALNEEKYLPILLDCLVSQTNKNFEVIVCDGKSEDNTQSIANSYKDRLSIRVIVSDKRNLAHQRNLGAQNAKGDYIAFLDSDFKVKNDFVESCFRESERVNADLIIPFSYPITNSWFWKAYFGTINYLSFFSTVLGRSSGNGPGNIIKKEAFAKTGGYNEGVYVFEDQYFFLVAKKVGLKLKNDKNIQMYFSLRRLEKGGVLGYFYFNFYAAMYFAFRGPIYKKFYNYKMGGDAPKTSK
jgi:glycosyltransferase involved in cell wall biosynthesis